VDFGLGIGEVTIADRRHNGQNLKNKTEKISAYDSNSRKCMKRTNNDSESRSVPLVFTVDIQRNTNVRKILQEIELNFQSFNMGIVNLLTAQRDSKICIPFGKRIFMGGNVRCVVKKLQHTCTAHSSSPSK
jgi:hypothetical protein